MIEQQVQKIVVVADRHRHLPPNEREPRAKLPAETFERGPPTHVRDLARPHPRWSVRKSNRYGSFKDCWARSDWGDGRVASKLVIALSLALVQATLDLHRQNGTAPTMFKRLCCVPKRCSEFLEFEQQDLIVAPRNSQREVGPAGGAILSQAVREPRCSNCSSQAVTVCCEDLIGQEKRPHSPYAGRGKPLDSWEMRHCKSFANRSTTLCPQPVQMLVAERSGRPMSQ